MEAKIQAFIDSVKVRNGNEPEFIQAVTEVAETVLPLSKTIQSITTLCCWNEWLSQNVSSCFACHG